MKNLTNTTKLELIKEIKTNWGRNVKYYKLPYSKTIEQYMDVNARVLKVVTMPAINDTNKVNVTEERFYSIIGNEYTTKLEYIKYRSKFVTINK